LISSVDSYELYTAFSKFLKDCPTANYADFIEEIKRGDCPEIAFDEDAVISVVPPTAPLATAASELATPSASSLSALSAPATVQVAQPVASSASSTAGASAPTPTTTAGGASQTPTTTPCKFTFDDYARMSRSADEMLLKCIEPGCSLLRREHPKPVKETAFKMPSRDNFPTFRDARDKLMSDPYEFLQRLERALKLHSVPVKQYGAVLVSCITDRIQQEWVELNILTVCPTWADIKRKFQEKYVDARLKGVLLRELDDCTQEYAW
jgi:hypothetical protein